MKVTFYLTGLIYFAVFIWEVIIFHDNIKFGFKEKIGRFICTLFSIPFSTRSSCESTLNAMEFLCFALVGKSKIFQNHSRLRNNRQYSDCLTIIVHYIAIVGYLSKNLISNWKLQRLLFFCPIIKISIIYNRHCNT